MKKKNDKTQEQLNTLRAGLEPLGKFAAVPDSLSADSITAAVSQTKQKKSKKGKVIVMRTAGALAAALAVTICAGAALKLYRTPAVKQMPPAIANAQAPVSNNDKSTLVNYFTALRSEYDKQNKYSFFQNEGMKNSATAEVDESAPDTATSEHGQTNNQVAGVEEDDIVKNDGRYIYVLSNNSLKIIDAANAQSIKLMSTTKIDRGENGFASSLYVYGGKAVVLGMVYSDTNEKTFVEIYDIGNKAAPEKIKSFEQDGAIFTTRMTGSRLYLVSQYSVFVGDLDVKSGYTDYNEIAPATSVDGDGEVPLEPNMITILPQSSYSDSYLVLSSLNLDSLAAVQPKTSAILGAGNNAYCTEKALFIASTEYENANNFNTKFGAVADIAWASAKCKTHIYKFSLAGGSIALECDGTVDGGVNNQFSMDEKDGYFRIATTSANDENDEINLITVLDASLKKVGKVEGFAKGETIRSVRYIGNYGYVVTFEQTDPLFVIDFTKPTEPKIVGELKLPGFSSYLHPFNGYVVGIGTDGDEDGATNALKVSLFDISNPQNPREIDKLVIPNAYSDISNDHKCVMDYASENILGFTYAQDKRSSNGNYLGCDYKFITLKVENGKLETLAGYVNYSDAELEALAAKVYSPDSDTAYSICDCAFTHSIQRGTYIGSTLYTCSNERICAWPVEGGTCISKLDY